MKRQHIIASHAVPAKGPYSSGYQIGDTLYISAQLPLTDEGTLLKGSIKAQAVQILENLEQLLEAASMSLKHLVKTTVYLASMHDYDVVNQVFAIYLSHPYPARSCVSVSELPLNAGIAIDAVAVYSDIEEDYDDEGGCEGCYCDDEEEA